MTWWQYALFPFAVLYDLITRLRNRSFDLEIIKPIHFDANVIGVGNLSLGGTGKTPFVLYLTSVFKKLETPVSILSRGYKRRSTGFRQVHSDDTALTVGDEPLMYHLRDPETGVFVARERVMAIPQLLFHRPQTHVILMDDSMQHRTVLPDFQIMLTTYGRPFFDDFIVPAGRLRECRRGAERANCIVVTKCPQNLGISEEKEFRNRIARYSNADVFFCTVEYESPKPIFDNDKPLMNRHIGVSGIADPRPFEGHLSQNYNCRIIHHYPDHYRYRDLDIQHIINELDEETSLLTTEKDMVKLREFERLVQFSCYYIPIKMKFLKDESLFLSKLDSSLKKGAFK